MIYHLQSQLVATNDQDSINTPMIGIGKIRMKSLLSFHMILWTLYIVNIVLICHVCCDPTNSRYLNYDHERSNKKTIGSVLSPMDIDEIQMPFKDKYKFKLHKSSNASQANYKQNHDYNLPSWFNYELYKKHYNKKYANENVDNVREKIYLQTALKVLDHRAKFRINKSGPLVFINELSDLKNEEIQNIAKSSEEVKYDDQLTKGPNVTCCSYEQAIGKLKVYYRMSDADLQQAIIDEITEKKMLTNQPDRRISYVNVEDKSEKPPFVYSVYHKELAKSKHEQNNIADQDQDIEDLYDPINTENAVVQQKHVSNAHSGNPSSYENVSMHQNWIASTDRLDPSKSRLKINETGDRHIAEAAYFNISKPNNRSIDAGRQYRQESRLSPLNYKNAHTVSGYMSANNNDRDSHLDTKENISRNDDNNSPEPQMYNDRRTEQTIQLDVAQSRESDDQKEIESEEENKMLELDLQQAVQDQIMEQLRLQVSEQLQQKFSQKFGRPVVVRPRLIYTISTTPQPTNDLNSITYNRLQKQQDASDVPLDEMSSVSMTKYSDMERTLLKPAPSRSILNLGSDKGAKMY